MDSYDFGMGMGRAESMKVWLLRLAFAKCGNDVSLLWSVSLCKIDIFFEKFRKFAESEEDDKADCRCQLDTCERACYK